MAALAGMLRERGYRVRGSDQSVYPPMSDFLAATGIPVFEGYAAANLEPCPDLVIVGNVVRAVNPEAIRLAELGIPYLSMPQALGKLFLQDRLPLVVCGTHGKTTTSSILATTLHRAGVTPSFMIGGLVEAFGRNFNLSPSPYFVVEGDEYDTAFFNKVSKFHHYRPHCAIITSIEFDHADIFTDLQMIKDSFAEFIARIPEEGLLVACGDDPVVRELGETARCPVAFYGTTTDCLWQLTEFQPRGMTTSFSLLKNGQRFHRLRLPMPGLHNALNATGVTALMEHLGFSGEAIAAGIAGFEGVRKRQQIRGEIAGVTVIDDFAHHPSAVRQTTRALRQAFPDRRLLVVFEPRTNTSRRAIFQQEYAEAFTGADLILVREHLMLDTVPPDQQFSCRQLARDLREKGLAGEAFKDTTAILDRLEALCTNGDVVVIFSNGGFDGIHERLLEKLRARLL
ncbi:MAG: UDP-N-acetylmuramate:L-alanyl-gamma-D-glutamyl-meso-diaminopimelate ligase [Deltaproteobacteria bacterium]|nr:MAG: UDP-N-acetylmuramate:L-alanyl-gamma-D-glutamyl-meso-diaminopimelate ligase [Deltaproteobacteria bacterium]